MIIGPREDSVTSIHKRWHFTQINPSSYKISLAISELAAIILVIISYFPLQSITLTFGINIVLVGVIVIALVILDYYLLRRIPINKISKITHVSAFAYIFWLVTVIFGIVSNFYLEKNTQLSTYIVEGMFLAVGLRYSIFVSVFGAAKLKSLVVAFVAPLIFVFVALTYSLELGSFSIVPIIFGILYLTISIVWSFYADHSARPLIRSTFEILQAFLLAWTEKKKENIEAIFESRAIQQAIDTRILHFRSQFNESVSLILPEVHPGPFSPIGGSNLPFLLFKLFHRKAVVFHSVSDHSLNLPSASQVEKFMDSLKNCVIKSEGKLCTVPLQLNSEHFTVTGIGFSSSALVIVSKKSGMEDLPFSIRASLEKSMTQFGIDELLLIDAHNGIGEKINQVEEQELFELVSECLRQLEQGLRYPFKISYFNTDSAYDGIRCAEDIGESGLGVIGFEINDMKYVLGWSDSNNIVDGLKIKIISRAKERQINMLEVVSSDSHATSGKRTRKGYYSLGDRSNHNLVSNIFVDLASRALENLRSSDFQIFQSTSTVKLMGSDQFNAYSSALNKSMKITKISVIITSALYLLMIILS